MSNYVYVIQSESGHIKIGVTSDVQGRLANLQTGSPYKLTLHLHIECHSREDALALESMLHDRYAVFRVSGEWFNYPIEQVASDISWTLRAARHIDGINRYISGSDLDSVYEMVEQQEIRTTALIKFLQNPTAQAALMLAKESGIVFKPSED